MATTFSEAVSEDIRRALPRNFCVNILDGGFFFLGLSFASTVTVLPLFVSQLTDSPFLIGLIPAIQSMGWLLPQLLTAPFVERLPRKKPYVLAACLNERWPFVGMMLLALAVPNLATSTALTLFFILHACRTFGSGFTATAWQDMIGKIIPARRRGVFFGLQSGLGGLLGAGGAIVAGLILEAFPFAINFAICFGMAAVFAILSLAALAGTYEPAGPVKPRSGNIRAYLARLPVILRANAPFRSFILYRILYLLGNMSVAFFTVYAVNSYGLDNAQAGQLTFVMMAAQTVTYPAAGWLGDHLGHRRVMEIAALSGVGMTAMAWLAPSGWWFVGVYLLLGISSASAMVSHLSGVYDFSAPEDRATYIGLTSTLVGIPSILTPILGATVVTRWSYEALFALTSLIFAAGWLVVRFGMRTAKDVPLAETAIVEP